MKMSNKTPRLAVFTAYQNSSDGFEFSIEPILERQEEVSKKIWGKDFRVDYHVFNSNSNQPLTSLEEHDHSIVTKMDFHRLSLAAKLMWEKGYDYVVWFDADFVPFQSASEQAWKTQFPIPLDNKGKVVSLMEHVIPKSFNPSDEPVPITGYSWGNTVFSLAKGNHTLTFLNTAMFNIKSRSFVNKQVNWASYGPEIFDDTIRIIKGHVLPIRGIAFVPFEAQNYHFDFDFWMKRNLDVWIQTGNKKVELLGVNVGMSHNRNIFWKIASKALER